MATIEREFYCSARGPAPTDDDTWRLVFDPRAMRLLVRHEWEAAGHPANRARQLSRGTKSSLTLRWRERDSNFWSRFASHGIWP
jgi:hypothetical protein